MSRSRSWSWQFHQPLLSQFPRSQPTRPLQFHRSQPTRPLQFPRSQLTPPLQFHRSHLTPPLQFHRSQPTPPLQFQSSQSTLQQLRFPKTLQLQSRSNRTGQFLVLVTPCPRLPTFRQLLVGLVGSRHLRSNRKGKLSAICCMFSIYWL